MGLRGERAIIRSSEGHEERAAGGSLTSAMSKRRESSLSVSTSDVLMWRLVVLELIMDGRRRLCRPDDRALAGPPPPPGGRRRVIKSLQHVAHLGNATDGGGGPSIHLS